MILNVAMFIFYITNVSCYVFYNNFIIYDIFEARNEHRQTFAFIVYITNFGILENFLLCLNMAVQEMEDEYFSNNNDSEIKSQDFIENCRKLYLNYIKLIDIFRLFDLIYGFQVG